MLIINVPDNLQRNHGRVNHLFAHLCEIHGHDIADARLHLPKPPIEMGGAAHEHSRFKYMMRHRIPPQVSASAAQMPHEPDLPALIAARICHDLISPLGAIGNGVELLEMSNSTGGPELELVRESVQQAQARIRLFRIAFGSVRADQTIGADELQGILRDYCAQARFDLEWTPAPSQPKPLVKLGLLALLCVECALPYGGHAVCAFSDTGLHITARAEKPKLDTSLWTPIADGGPWPDGLRAAHVQFPLLTQEASAQGLALAVTVRANGVDLQITAD